MVVIVFLELCAFDYGQQQQKCYVLSLVIRTNIPVEISAKLYVNFQHEILTAIIDGDYYLISDNEAVKAAELTWELIHV